MGTMHLSILLVAVAVVEPAPASLEAPSPVEAAEAVVPVEAVEAPQAVEAAPPSPPVETVSAKPPAPAPVRAEFNSLGMSVDAGVPDFGGVNLSYRPMGWHWLRLEGGVMSTGSNFGARAGLTLVPFHWAMRLTFTGEVGRMFQGDASGLLGQGDPTLSKLLSSVGYDFANGHAGLEFGSKNFGFFLRGGVSYIDFKFDNAIEAIPAEAGNFTGAPVRARLTLPTFKLGVNFYFI
jgi:hypothetical protein